MKKISVKYKVNSNGYTSNVIVFNNTLEIAPYNYTSDDILLRKISKKKLKTFIEHLSTIQKIKK